MTREATEIPQYTHAQIHETLPAAVKVLMAAENEGKKIELPELIVRIAAQRKTGE